MNNNKQKTILVVEDEPGLREAIKFKLIQAGINVITANTGEKAIEALNKNKPDLVWLDMLLPGINGLEVLRRIRKTETMKDLPVVIVSVSAGPEKIKEASSLSIADYIVKSEYGIEDIVKKATNLLEQLDLEKQ